MTGARGVFACLLAAACAALAVVWIVRMGGGLRAALHRRTVRHPGAALRRLLGLIPRAVPRLVERAARRDAPALIAQAGLGGLVGEREIAAARVACGLTGGLLAVRVASGLPARMAPAVLAVCVALGSETPPAWLRRRAAVRRGTFRRALPDALDLLRACVEAGLPLRRAFVLVGSNCAEPVAGELLAISAEIAFGVPQATALDGLAARNPMPQVRALVAALRMAERHGSPLGPAIAAQAHDARLALNREIVEHAARAGPKIQLLVSVTIVPGAMLGFAAAVIAAIARGDLRFM